MELSASTVLIVGVGSLGTVSAKLLCEAGVEKLILCDYDIVEERNLERQPFYSPDDIGKLKVLAAEEHLKDFQTQIETNREPFSEKTPLDGVDLILDGTDSLEARAAMNAAARRANIPLIICTASEERAMVFPVTGSPCWECITQGKTSQDTCDTGISPDVVKRAVDIQVKIGLRLIQGGEVPQDLVLIQVNGARAIRVEENPSCNTCAGREVMRPFTVRYCEATSRLQARPSRPAQIDLLQLDDILEKFPTCVRVKLGGGTALVHRHGLIEFTDVSEDTAKSYAEGLIKDI